MAYNVVVTSDAEKDLDKFIRYLLFEKKNEQAARNLLDDFEETKNILSNVAASLKDCDNPKLKQFGYKWLMLYKKLRVKPILKNWSRFDSFIVYLLMSQELLLSVLAFC